MDNYQPPFTITNTMLELVAAISEKVGHIRSRRELEARPYLRRNNRIKSVHASLRIEANSLSLSEVRDVINGHTVLGDPKEIREVQNAYRAYELLQDWNPFSLTDLKKAHAVMTDALQAESGIYRSGNEGVFRDGRCIFIAPPPELVPTLMQNLFEWMQSSRSSVHPLIQAAVFHYEFVFIHPFSDGNGRMARLWHTALLTGWRSIFAHLPLESQIEACQEEYYAAIAQCHSNGNSNVFIEFMLQQIDRTLTDIINRISLENAEVTEYVARLLSVMEYDVPYTTLSIMEKLNLKSRETFRKNYMQPALSLGLIEMTIPDKPNSRNQRYVRRS